MQQPALAGALLDGKYRIGRTIGRGGMGAVYQAQHVGTGRPVAVKVILPALLRSSEAIERFRREARAAGRLRHPNIVDVTDFGVVAVDGQDVAYLVMEYLEGSTLRALIEARGALPLDVVVNITEQIAVAVSQAHAAGIVHRDLKPDNVWLVNDARGGFTIRVLDFGIARLGEESHREGGPEMPISTDTPASAADTPTIALTASPDDTLEKTPPGPDVTAVMTEESVDSKIDTARLTTAGSLIGTPLYMSPEQCLGQDVDRRSDIYSLGVMIFEMLTGRRPFHGSAREVIEQHLRGEPPPLEGVPPRVAAVVARAMARFPDERYSSAQALAGSLRVAAEGPGLIVRRSIALYAERLDDFFRIALLASWPPVAAGLVMFVIVLVVLVVPDTPRAVLILVMLPVVSAPILWTFVTMMTNAMFAAAIERLRLRPLERIDARELGDDLRRRVGLPPSAGYIATAWRVGSYYTRCELRSQAGAGDLAFLIGFLEGVPMADIPPRCAVLAAQSKHAYNRVRLGILTAVFAVPFVEAAVFALLLRSYEARGLIASLSMALALLPLNAMLVNPIFSSALALLYFRARQANGEDVPMAAVLPGRL
ncbi:MAG TPA: serine/threonine-protein kinase [Thermoanaerobaculia bacterium]|nr:serine/threonine-protein kinase [Thermoanaerobaculia bacterium]